MFSKPTVFIIGAGASCDYGYPVGRELYEKACESMIKGTKIFKCLQELEFTEGFIKKFRHELFIADPGSIDEFVNDRDEYEDIGKAAIALLLVVHEERSYLMRKGFDSWYHLLKNNMKPTVLEDFSLNEVAFITFNYDRSLEFYLWNFLKSTFNKDVPTTAKYFSKIPIVHMYGKLGDYPWKETNTSRFYKAPQPNDMKIEIRKCVKEIHLLYENRDASPEFESAFELLEDAEDIHFLGFGYNNDNLTNLGIAKLKNNKSPKPKRISGTSRGMTSFKIQDINSKFNISLQTNLNQKQYLNIPDYLRDVVGLF